MKTKYGILILTIALLLSLVSCQPADTSSPDTDTAQQTAAEATAAETAPQKPPRLFWTAPSLLPITRFRSLTENAT